MVQQLSGTKAREEWGTRLGFICAAVGSAVGLGNIWRFPYITGENGGAAFIVVYLLCILWTETYRDRQDLQIQT